LRRFFEAIDAGWFPANPPETPATPAQTPGTRKKFADRDLFRGEKPGKTPVLGGQYRPRMHRMEVKTWQRERKELRLHQPWSGRLSPAGPAGSLRSPASIVPLYSPIVPSTTPALARGWPCRPFSAAFRPSPFSLLWFLALRSEERACGLLHSPNPRRRR
jgi:hypothetical protein